MNAQLLLSPSLFEMDHLARQRYHERPNEGMSVETFINHVKAGTNGEVRYEREFEVQQIGSTNLMHNMLDYMWSVENRSESIGFFDFPDLERCDGEGNSEGCLETRPTRDEWFMLNRTKGGAKFSRVLLKKLKKLPETDDFKYTLASLKNAIAEWGKYPLDKEKFTVVATREPNAFMRLGNNKCDKASCYRQSSDYSPHSPLNLAVTPDIYVFYVKRGDDVLGRAWGQLVEGSECFYSNTYSRGMPGGSDGARAVIKEALKYWGNIGWSDCCGVEGLRGQYWNGDLYGNESTITCKPSPYEFTHNKCTCEACEESIDEDNSYYVEGHGYYCDCCLNDHFNWCDMRSEYIHTDDSVYCSCLDDYIYESHATLLYDGEYCPEEDAIELYDGDYCLIDDAIVIDLGEHSGCCTRDGDADLMTTDDGETYIEGTYTPESEDDS